MIFSRRVCARATRTALIVASVPELTKRTISTRRHQRAHELAELYFELGRCAEARALSRCGRERLDQAARRVPVNQRAPRHHVVDVRASVDVGDARARCAANEQRRAADGLEGANGAVDAAGRSLSARERRASLTWEHRHAESIVDRAYRPAREAPAPRRERST